jgi:hypothetical protein
MELYCVFVDIFGGWQVFADQPGEIIDQTLPAEAFQIN